MAQLSQTITRIASVGALAGAGVMAASVAVESLPILAIGSGIAVLASITGGTSLLVGRHAAEAKTRSVEAPVPAHA